MALFALSIASCKAENLPPVHLVIRVYNQGHAPGLLHWEQVNPDVSSRQPAPGDATIGPCTEVDHVFGPGTWQLTITSSRATQVTMATAPPTGQAFYGYAIRGDGRIESLYHVTSGQLEPSQSPGC